MTFRTLDLGAGRADRAGRARAGPARPRVHRRTAIANNLNQFRREKELLEQQLREALAELPEEKKVDGSSSCSRIARRSPASRSARSSRRRRSGTGSTRGCPSDDDAGNFHEIATFFDALGRMRRIVNVSDILLDTPKDANGKIVLNAKFLATAFMFVETASPGPAAGGGAAMSPRRTLLVLAAALAAGCGDSPKPRRPAPAPVAAAPQPAARRAGAASPGRRRRVVVFVRRQARPVPQLPLRALEAERRARHPLRHAARRVRLERLKLVAVVTGLEDPVAMVQAPNGVGYSLRRGACIGKNGGTVAAVRSGEVVIAEWAVRADGTRDRTQTVMRLPREAAMNLEESRP